MTVRPLFYVDEVGLQLFTIPSCLVVQLEPDAASGSVRFPWVEAKKLCVKLVSSSSKPFRNRTSFPILLPGGFDWDRCNTDAVGFFESKTRGGIRESVVDPGYLKSRPSGSPNEWSRSHLCIPNDHSVKKICTFVCSRLLISVFYTMSASLRLKIRWPIASEE
jgi:hypothetical protein